VPSKMRSLVLEVFKRENRQLTPKEAAGLAGLNPNTTRRIVQELAKGRYLKKVEGTRKYVLG
jgi:DNA-binding IclR family transcriptional regulator